MRVRTSALLILFLILVCVPASGQDAVDILKKSYAAEGKVSMTGRLKTTVYGSSPAAAEVRISRSGRQSRIEYTTGPLKGTVIIDDGSSVIRLDSGAKTAYLSGTPDPPERLNLLLQNYQPVMVGGAKIAGRDCYEIKLSSRHPRNPFKKLWIDKKSLVALKTERYSSDAKLAMSSEYIAADFSSRPAASQFRIPSGWKSVRLAAESDSSLDAVKKAVGFTPLRPTYVPKGYSFDGYYIRSTQTGNKFAGLRYTNGLNSISVFQQAVRGRGLGGGRGGFGGGQGLGRGRGQGACMQAEGSQTRMLNTMIGNISITVVADLSEAEIRKIAASVK